jgi:hypothetical protein
MTEVARKTDQLATKADLAVTTADLRAAFERQTERLTLILGGMLIAGFAAMGFVIFAVVPPLVP